jgi:hypothetical protein
MHRFIDGEDRMQQRCYRIAWRYVSEENPVRVIEVFIDELDLAALGFSGMTPAATGRDPSTPCWRAPSSTASIPRRIWPR